MTNTNEFELRELLKLIRGVEHFIERMLRSEEEKNKEAIEKHLEKQNILVIDDTVDHEDDGLEFNDEPQEEIDF